jgi:Bacterial lectin
VRIHILFIFAVSFVALAFATTPAFADTIPLSSLDLVGTSTIIPDGTLRLTNNTVVTTTPSPAGAAWTPTQYNVAAPFSANFQFQFTDPTGHLDGSNGGDGIAFLIQNSPQGTSAIGVGAGGMGFLGIQDSVAVMLDTYQNSSPPYYGDPSDNYIAINTRGSSFNTPHHFCTYVPSAGQYELTANEAYPSDLNGSSFSPYCDADPTLAMTGFVTGTGPTGSLPGVTGFPALSVDMDNGDVYDLDVVYTGSVLDIYLDGALVLAANINLAAEVGGPDAYLGFTAGTQNAFQNQDILSFSETTIPEPAWGQLWVPLAMLLAVALARKWQRGRA